MSENHAGELMVTQENSATPAACVMQNPLRIHKPLDIKMTMHAGKPEYQQPFTPRDLATRERMAKDHEYAKAVVNHNHKMTIRGPIHP